MRIVLSLKDSNYNYEIKITDSHGKRYYSVFAAGGKDAPPSSISVDVDNDFLLSLTPIMPDASSFFNNAE